MTKAEKIPEDRIAAELEEAGLRGWWFEDGWIRRKISTDGWPQTLMAVGAVGFVCEAAHHHADLAVTWGKLWVKLQDHSAGGITAKDLAVARRIEDSLLWRPDADGPLAGGTPERFVFTRD